MKASYFNLKPEHVHTAQQVAASNYTPAVAHTTIHTVYICTMGRTPPAQW
jgi:hypothetical protein